MTKTSRQKLLNYLEKKQFATAKDISLALNMTPANARHHLSILIDQGIVKMVGTRAGPNRGRPQNLYMAAKTDSNENITKLIYALIQQLFENVSDKQKENILRAVANRIINGDLPEKLNPTQRLNQTVYRLNQNHYEARWEAHLASPHVIFNNCPYLAIVEDIPEICKVDNYILENMLGIPVDQIAKLELSPLGWRRCIFTLGEK